MTTTKLIEASDRLFAAVHSLRDAIQNGRPYGLHLVEVRELVEHLRVEAEVDRLIERDKSRNAR